MSDVRFFSCAILVGLVLAVIGAIGTAATVAQTGGTYAHAPHVGRCFPASLWDGDEGHPDSVRPCVRVSRVYEDGSFKYAVSDANGTVRYSGGVGAADR